jgi:hypothetical protein
MTAWLVYLLFGLVAGVLAGLLGVGGGLVLVAGLAWLLPSQGVPESAAMHAALATSLASIVLTGLSSARAHHRRGSVLWATVRWLVPGLLLGASLGSLLATRLPGEWLRMGVAAYCLLAAAQLWFDWPRSRPLREDAPRGPGYSAAGVAIGAVSSFVGIGGGSMTVPLLAWRGVAPVRAVGTSSACGVAIALASAVGYAGASPAVAMPGGSIGYVFLPAAIAIALAALVAAPWGAALAHRLSGPALKRIFAGFLLLVGLALVY